MKSLSTLQQFTFVAAITVTLIGCGRSGTQRLEDNTLLSTHLQVHYRNTLQERGIYRFNVRCEATPDSKVHVVRLDYSDRFKQHVNVPLPDDKCDTPSSGISATRASVNESGQFYVKTSDHYSIELFDKYVKAIIRATEPKNSL
jgi:hypothetical protein